MPPLIHLYLFNLQTSNAPQPTKQLSCSKIQALHTIYLSSLGVKYLGPKMNQVLDQRYIDKQRLFSLLTRLFPNGDFSVEVRVIK